ncbi:hypothetical protein L596_014156 [Steinernema carpocapsae]|uniref:Uncharacterized protein n=1 Tax=Steinernema carpocapsae TaxID=34508 RepID=A0A4U5NB71_STECR|nr:hypothetical protein L596_014156 [Steinernema carpocapsae]
MTDLESQANFKRFVEQNLGDKGITAKSKIVRTINRIENSNGFFKSVSNQEILQIGGRKGKTLLLGNNDGLTRVNPNKVDLSQPSTNKASFILTTGLGKLPEHIKNQDVRQMLANYLQRNNLAIEEAILETSINLGTELKCNSFSDYVKLTEYIASTLNSLDKIAKDLKLKQMKKEGNNGVFAQALQREERQAMSIAVENGRIFESPMAALHLYRLYGEGFAKILPEDSDFYFGERVKILLNGDQCVVEALQENSIAVKVLLMSNETFGILVEREGKPLIATVFSDMLMTGRFAKNAQKRFMGERQRQNNEDTAELVKSVGREFGIQDWKPLFYIRVGFSAQKRSTNWKNSRQWTT